MGRPKKKQSELTVETLLDAAEANFARDGFMAANLAEIASEAGITRPSLLYHFKSKEGLYEAVIERIFERIAEKVRHGLVAGEESRASVAELAAAITAFFRDHSATSSLIVREILAPRGPGQEKIREHAPVLLDSVEAWIRSIPGLRTDVSVRDVMMQVVTSALMRGSNAALAHDLWGPESSDYHSLIYTLFEEER